MSLRYRYIQNFDHETGDARFEILDCPPWRDAKCLGLMFTKQAAETVVSLLNTYEATAP